MAASYDVWAHFNEGGALNFNVVSRSEAEELSLRVAELEDEVSPYPSPRHTRLVNLLTVYFTNKSVIPQPPRLPNPVGECA